MFKITITELRAGLAKYLDAVERGDEVIVTRRHHESMAIVPLKELGGLRETLHLLSSRANGEHLLASIAELDRSRHRAHLDGRMRNEVPHLSPGSTAMDSRDGCRHIVVMQFTVNVSHDEAEHVWFVQSSDVPGLNAEAPTLDELVEVIADVAPELIASNLPDNNLSGDSNIALRVEHVVNARRAPAA